MNRKIINKFLNPLGYELNKKNPFIGPDGIAIDMAEPGFVKLRNLCKPYTLCSDEALFALYNAVQYVVKNRIPGDLVECGVFKGGSAMMMAASLKHFGCAMERKIYLYDTFEGMSKPTGEDRDLTGNTAEELLSKGSRDVNSVWAYSPLEEVKQNMARTSYDAGKIIYVKGMVENTIPGTMPEKISLLRLDTDWYNSTKHEMEHLFPRLVSRGVMIVDDYGHWEGSRKAVDEGLAGEPNHLLLNRVDWTVRMTIKQ